MALNKKSNSNDWTMESVTFYLSEIVQKESGNVLSGKQESMVRSRLQKRMSELKLDSPEEYIEFFHANERKETLKLVSLLTTHHTYFFREMIHFEFLEKQLPTIISDLKKRGESTLRIYSGACSKGQEVYSLALFFKYHMKSYPGIDFKIYGTDIDPESVEIAKDGVYPLTELKTIPSVYIQDQIEVLNNNFQEGMFKDSLKKYCEFSVHNLMHKSHEFFNKPFDIIICRNVFIYFDKETITSIVKTLKEKMTDSGYLITGVSESLIGLVEDINSLAPSVYSFNSDVKVESSETVKKKVLIVDDSKSTLKILKKIIESDGTCEVVGQAENGEEAHAFLMSNKVDIMTLDIHMPILNGVEYLQKYYDEDHPPVVMVSSAKREDKNYSTVALDSGASDFIEKPTLYNYQEKAEEILNKLHSLIKSEGKENSNDSFQAVTIDDNEKGIVVLLAQKTNEPDLKHYLDNSKLNNTPILILNYGDDEIDLENTISLYSSSLSNLSAKVYVGDFEQVKNDLVNEFSEERVCFCVFGKGPDIDEAFLDDFYDLQILVEENEYLKTVFSKNATDIFPATSFEVVSSRFIKTGRGSNDN